MRREGRVFLEVGDEVGRGVLSVHEEHGEDHAAPRRTFRIELRFVRCFCNIVGDRVHDDVSFLPRSERETLEVRCELYPKCYTQTFLLELLLSYTLLSFSFLALLGFLQLCRFLSRRLNCSVVLVKL